MGDHGTSPRHLLREGGRPEAAVSGLTLLLLPLVHPLAIMPLTNDCILFLAMNVRHCLYQLGCNSGVGFSQCNYESIFFYTACSQHLVKTIVWL